jgi:hypothetical protein
MFCALVEWWCDGEVGPGTGYILCDLSSHSRIPEVILLAAEGLFLPGPIDSQMKAQKAKVYEMNSQFHTPVLYLDSNPFYIPRLLFMALLGPARSR